MKIRGIAVLCVLLMFPVGADSRTVGGPTITEKVVESLGGLSRLMDVQTIKTTSHTINFGAMTSYAVGAPPIHLSDGEDVTLWQPVSQRFRIHSRLEALVPFPGGFDFKEAFDGTRATRSGPRDFRPGTDPALPGVYLGARLKRLWLDHPQWLVYRMKTEGRRSLHGKEMHVFVLTERGARWEMLVDPVSLLPHAMTVQEVDGLRGEIRLEVRYTDWRNVDGIMMPFRLEQFTGGVLSRREVRAKVLVNVEATDQDFRLAEMSGVEPHNSSDRIWGWNMSHWFLGRFAMGRSSETRQVTPVEFREIGEGIFQVTGTNHHNLVIVGEESLAVIEAPFYPERSKVVLAALRERWPGKPVEFLILTHHHLDHVGGMSEYVRAGAQLVVPAGNAAFFDKILADNAIPHKKTIAVGDRSGLPDFGRQVELLSVPNSHAFDMILAYFPDQKLLFATDIYSPGRPKQPPNYPGELLQAIEYYDLDVDLFIGGHGAGPDDFSRFLEFAK